MSARLGASSREYEVACMKAAQDDAAMAATSGMQTVTAADGRTLAIAECGDSDGFPVLWLHGTPGSRFAGQGFDGAYADVGAHVITYDRPGYGGSDRFRGRRQKCNVVGEPPSVTNRKPDVGRVAAVLACRSQSGPSQ
jgi:pimeloyl-ACP methyl ester carboxylesterase